nr:putative ribonuclease H-like domain-containing protein [Tanacetum cinerariifolium]
FEDFFDNSINEDYAAGSLVPVVGQISTNTFSAAGPSNVVVFRNKKDERGIIVGNKDRLVAQRHTQEEGIDYKEVFALVERIESIILLLAYASFMGFMVYQMDVKSAFLYGTIEEEVYSPGFKYPDYPDKVYKVVKALYGLHQAPRARYETLANYLLENGFQKGKIDQTLFIKWQKGNILLCQIYVDDIIFCFTNKDLCKDFEKLMKNKFQMSSIRELTFFLGLQVKQKKDGIFISQDKYVAEIIRKFGLTDGKSSSTPIDTEKPLLKDPDGEDEELLQFKMQKVWVLVDLPHEKRSIGTKWVFRNKKDGRGIVVRNKARLVAQGHTQEEGIDYEEDFALVARIEAIRLFLAYASFIGFMVYQMNVKSAFLYETIEEK